MASQVSSEAAQAQVADAETLSDDTVVIVGGGPVGLTLATVLAYYGVKSVLFERNQTTTRWPKMDLTNARSMEIFRRLGLADSLRAQGVPSHYPYRVIVSTGLSRDMPITQWDHPSVDKYRENIQKQNDGTMPLEPYQRLSQALFEAWLKKIDDANPLIDLRYGWKVEKVEANGEDVKTVAVNVNSGKRCSLISNYVAGCDGASSKVRTGLGIPLDGGPTPGFVLLVHFISKDLARLRKQGQFWHNFLIAPPGTIGGAIIAQDEVDTWTTHLFLPLDADESKISSEEAVYRVLGGMGEDYEITIDEVLVRSTYRPNIAVARTYSALNGRVFLAGDAAHQNIPTGGYGMNMGIADAYDLGWKLAAVVSGHGEKGLLQCYEMERRPVAFTSVERSKVHIGTHAAIGEILQSDPTAIDADTEQGRLMRQRIHDHYQTHDGENKDLGVEMDFHYKSPVNISDESLGAELLGPPEPEWDPRRYVPSTFPGHRAPHVFLSDGTAIFDHYGKDYTLVEFSDGSDRGASRLVEAAKEASFPLKHTRLVDEEHAYKIWDQKRLVLVRPDGHVSWRSDHLQDAALAKRIVQTVAGAHIQMEADDRKAFTISGSDVMSSQTTGFTLEKMGDLQA